MSGCWRQVGGGIYAYSLFSDNPSLLFNTESALHKNDNRACLTILTPFSDFTSDFTILLDL